ncbi:Uncharacterized protein QJS10_CPB19g00406 [Acorus calamus]|uniref:F1F0-ATPase inhibitor protein n=1 Tax=Acorus calamus TaxID=4465 RepID=A0AAV9CIY1_ACOCL|nr:Uncharacterized protein QJS10_CPB19g00406 [Acorus calamus]
MAATITSRAAARFVSRRFSSGSGKILSEEEKAAENVYIKKIEQEKLEKLARKGLKAEEKPLTSDVPPATTATATAGATTTTTSGVSTNKSRNYAVLAGTAAALGGLGWYWWSSKKSSEEEVHD